MNLNLRFIMRLTLGGVMSCVACLQAQDDSDKKAAVPKFGKVSAGQTFEQFSTPAYIQDFLKHGGPKKKQQQALMHKHWSENIDSWSNVGITGNPWLNLDDHERWMYFNPIGKNVPKGMLLVEPVWIAFPHRVSYYCTQAGYSSEQILRFADYGELEDGTPLPCLPANACCGALAQPAVKGQPCKQGESDCGTTKAWNPFGPRGWCDEYCEWSVTRRPSKDGGLPTITSVSFTCENPEYWETLWKIDPDVVVRIYNELVNAGQYNNDKVVTLDDLYLKAADGTPIIDPQTGRPAYNIINKWNYGPHATEKSGGAIHLTSPPNTLGAEVYLAAAATIMRTHSDGTVPSSSETSILTARNLICSGKFGGIDRNSDPHIGDSVNEAVRAFAPGYRVTLNDPVGLYIQPPDFSSFQVPSDADFTIEDCWHMIRGNDFGMGLHAVFEVPGTKYTVSDILVDGKPILYAGQIAETFKIGLTACAWENEPGNELWPPMQPWPPSPDYPTDLPKELFDYPAVTNKTESVSPAPGFPLTGAQIFLAQTNERPQLAFAPAEFTPGSESEDYVLGVSVDDNNPLTAMTVRATGEGVEIEVIGYIYLQAGTTEMIFTDETFYTTTVDGKKVTQENTTAALRLRIKVAEDAKPGNRGLIVAYRGQPTDGITPALGCLEIVASKQTY